jgi:preprotein translocase subunit SecD
LKKAGISYQQAVIEGDKLIIRFGSTDNQLKASDILRKQLKNNYSVALALVPATPKWLQGINGRPMYLGLDLQGGIHFLMEVDMRAVIETETERYITEFRSQMREIRIRHAGIDRKGDMISIRFRDEATRAKAEAQLLRKQRDLVIKHREADRYFYLDVKLGEGLRREAKKSALEQNLTTLRNRVNELGVAEPVIQQQGDSRIIVQLPGVQDPNRAREILGATATLEFREVDERNRNIDSIVASGVTPPGTVIRKHRDGRYVLLKRRVILTGDYIKNARAGIESRTNTPAVFITLDDKGGRRFSNWTKDHIHDLMAVVFIETRIETVTKPDGKKVRKKTVTQEVISVAEIQARLGRNFQIEGLDSSDESSTLALLLRAGSLKAPVEIIQERTIGPGLGQDNIDKGMESVVIGFIAVLLFMALYYKLFGIVANVALLMNLVLLVAVLSMLQATLTLPGIAGIVLTIGMAVDANVLIFERIREELRVGNSPQASIHAGYEKAFSTIADANITTLIAALVLFSFGSGPIKGFAVTLSLGILTSMFTAIMGTRAIINLIYGGRRLKKISI